MKLTLSLIAVAGLALPSLAQEAEKAPRKVEADLKLSGFATGGADFDGDNGDVQVSSVGADLGVDLPSGERGTTSLSIGSHWSFYDFGGDAGFGASEPWEDVVEYTAGARYSRKANDTWGWFLGGFAASSGETGSDFSESVTGGGYVGASYAASDKFRIAFGAGYATRLEDDGYFIPIVNFRWEMAEKWTLSSDTQPKSMGLKLSYQATESIALLAAGGYMFNEYRLDEDGATPDGVGRDSGVPLALGVEWTISDQVSLGVRAGMVMAREFELDDSAGNELQSIDADAAPFLSATLNFTF